MTIPTPDHSAVVGRYYKVPCVNVNDWYGEYSGPMPIIGPMHEDAEVINFPYQHFHIDWRFAAKRVFGHATWTGKASRCYSRIVHKEINQSQPVPITDGDVHPRRMKCKREWPDYPFAMAQWIPKLENLMACQKMRNMICPHRGLPLNGQPVIDGNVTCPGHGLTWNIATGELVRKRT